jgi:carbon monoxide dehydrogenase subunit G
MELEHSFTVPVPQSRAWDVLLDAERVAPCMPGATLDSVDGDEIRGRIKVKVGPINMTYAGTARFIERDEELGVVTLEATGKETRGAGTASASVRSVLEDRGPETHVKVLTTLNVTGKPAQFGRGVLNEVGGRLLGTSPPTSPPPWPRTREQHQALPPVRRTARRGGRPGVCREWRGPPTTQVAYGMTPARRASSQADQRFIIWRGRRLARRIGRRIASGAGDIWRLAHLARQPASRSPTDRSTT